MTSLISRSASWLLKHRNRFPRWVNRILESPAKRPHTRFARLVALALGGRATVAATAVPDAPVRVYIGSANYAAQGYRWARALEASAPDIAARNVELLLPGGFGFPADTRVPFAVVTASAQWGAAEWAAARQFTHVLIEAQRPLFGRTFNFSLREEIAALEAAGVSVAYLCHGTDVRDPDRHTTLTPWSPYPEDPRTPELRAEARSSMALLREIPHPTFVSTPDLLIDVPWAHWCPVVVDDTVFQNDAAVCQGDVLRVVHSASIPVQKGSHLIEAPLAELVAAGSIDYQLITGTPWSAMPALYANCDVVLDQFRAGSYGVAACEAMAAGRVVIGHVLPEVRAAITAATGYELPIIEATPDTVGSVLQHLIEHPEEARAAALRGPEYVAAVHSGARSAAALLEHWIRRGSTAENADTEATA